jgi:hypothetical protein
VPAVPAEVADGYDELPAAYASDAESAVSAADMSSGDHDNAVSSDSSTSPSPEVAVAAVPAASAVDNYDGLPTASGNNAEPAADAADTSSSDDDDDDGASSSDLSAAGAMPATGASKLAGDSSNTVRRGLDFHARGLSDGSSDSTTGSATL